MTNIPDCVKLEMRCAELMAQQEASGFRFDLAAAEEVREELAREAEKLSKKICAVFPYFPGKVFVPKRTQLKNGYHAGAPMTKLMPFNPTSRQHIAWALTTFRGARFIKQTDTGKCVEYKPLCRDVCETDEHGCVVCTCVEVEDERRDPRGPPPLDDLE